MYAYDRKTGRTQLVAHRVDGTPTSGDSDNAAISPDGRFVAFQSYDDQIVTGDTNGYADGITAGGGTVVFDAQAHNLVTRPVGFLDLFLHRF